MKRLKYGNSKTYDGFDSKKEARRYQELLIMERAGKISDLKRQVKFILIPVQREYSREIYTKGRKKGCFKPGKILERNVHIMQTLPISRMTGALLWKTARA